MDCAINTRRLNNEEQIENLQDSEELSDEAVGQKYEMDDNGPKSLIMEIYPWIWEFKKMCRNSLTKRSISSLKNLMRFYARNVRTSVIECRTKPLRAEKLKNCISESLLFFLYYYRDVGESKDRDYYLTKMSDMLAMYIDMELKASKKGEEHCSKISSRLSFYLHVYLENSAEYLLETLLKVHFMNPNYQEILDPVVTKIFKVIDDHPCNDLMYVRYFLAFRLWKKLNKDVAIRNEINSIAQRSLGQAPNNFPHFILESVLPQVPKNQKLTTKIILVQKFELEKSCDEFLKFSYKEKGLKSIENEEGSSLIPAIVSSPEENNDSRDLEMKKNSNVSLLLKNQVTSSIDNSSILINDKNHDNSVIRESVSKVSTSSCNLSSSLLSTTTTSSSSSSLLRKRKKSKDIVFIDLTGELVKEKLIKKKKARRKLLWLERARKRINAKILSEKITTIEDSSQPEASEDNLGFECLRISGGRSSSSKMVDAALERRIKDKEESTKESGIIIEDNSKVSTMDEKMVAVVAQVDESGLTVEEVDAIREREETEKPEVCARKIVSVQREEETTTLSTTLRNNCRADEYPPEVKTKNLQESQLEGKVEEAERLETIEENCREVKSETIVEDKNQMDVTIKPEKVSKREETNDSKVCKEPEVLEIEDYAAEISLNNEETEDLPEKIGEPEFHDNIDGLSLLASVSQRISTLTMSSDSYETNVSPVELIKVKNYASLVNVKTVEESNEPRATMSQEILNIYPEDEMDKVAYQVEITSTEETSVPPYETCESSIEILNYSNEGEDLCNQQPQSLNHPVLNLESSNLVEKDDTNVILNGETVVLYQKSPNSNLYIINKAVENRPDHMMSNEDLATIQHRDIGTNERVVNESGGYSYDIYESLYRNQATTYDIPQYKGDSTLIQDSRRAGIIKSDQSGDLKKSCESLELSKKGKNAKSLETMVDDKARMKSNRKKLTNPSIPRRRRIKQEYNLDCPSGHVKSNYGIQDYAQDHSEGNHSIHIPVGHAAPISTMYGKYPTGTELYLPCHKNCNSMTCGLPVVNPTNGLHAGKNPSGSSRCSCLNCTYGLVAHCSEFLMPNGETRTTTTIDPNSYYMDLHSPQNSNLQERKISGGEKKSLSNIYDEQLVCKLEQKILENGESLSEVKYQTKDIYRAELDNKLPLKKRLKAIMSMSFVEEMPIKYEKIQSYPSTPMLSIAALEASQKSNDKSFDANACKKNCHKVGSKINEPGKGATPLNCHQSREMIRRDYDKETMMVSTSTVATSLQNGHRVNNGGKRKRTTSPSQNASREKIRKSANVSVKEKEMKSQSRPLEKVHNKDNTDLIIQPKKNAKRQTRSSKRNLPKVNYIYADGDSDWNPSGYVAPDDNSVNKRKRKKTTR